MYNFDRNGQMKLAIQPPDAFLPRRNGSISFNSASPPIYAPDQSPIPEDTETGRNNNQGLEAITISPDGKTLYTMIQSALDQEGGPEAQHRQPARILEYDISSPDTPVYKHEYVAMLPKYRDYTKPANDEKAFRVASQSEIHQLPTGDFLVLARDSDFGNGQKNTRSVYRHADIFSISNSTTDLKGSKFDGANASVASAEGILKPEIKPVEYCSFLDYNVNSELARFGLRNGGESGPGALNEKWESLALVPAEPSVLGDGPKEYFLFSFSDNDFMTQDGEYSLIWHLVEAGFADLLLGHMNFGRFDYADGSGLSLDNQVLVCKVSF